MPTLKMIVRLGHLTRDPEVRDSPSGTPVATLGLAVNTRVKGQDGQWREDPCVVDVVVFGPQAEACGESLAKSLPVLVEGRLRYRTWEDAHGTWRSTHEVLASQVPFIPRPDARPVSAPDPRPEEPPWGADDGDRACSSAEATAWDRYLGCLYLWCHQGASHPSTKGV